MANGAITKTIFSSTAGSIITAAEISKIQTAVNNLNTYKNNVDNCGFTNFCQSCQSCQKACQTCQTCQSTRKNCNCNCGDDGGG